MTYYLAELYSPKAAWLALDQAGRRRFFETIGTGMGPLLEMGIEPLASGETESTALHSSSQQFFALWRAPDQAAMNTLPPDGTTTSKRSTPRALASTSPST